MTRKTLDSQMGKSGEGLSRNAHKAVKINNRTNLKVPCDTKQEMPIKVQN